MREGLRVYKEINRVHFLRHENDNLVYDVN